VLSVVNQHADSKPHKLLRMEVSERYLHSSRDTVNWLHHHARIFDCSCTALSLGKSAALGSRVFKSKAEYYSTKLFEEGNGDSDANTVPTCSKRRRTRPGSESDDDGGASAAMAC
jgi:hypothetical protein